MQYKSLNIDFRQEDLSEYSGEAYYIINAEIFKKAADIYLEDGGNMSYEFKEVIEQIEENEETDATFYNVDLFISLVSVLADNDIKASITCVYDHIIWLFHDFSHIINDCHGYDVEVIDYAEERAIRDSIDFLLQNNIPVPYHILNNSNKEFSERFSYDVDFVGYALEQDNIIIPNNLDLETI